MNEIITFHVENYYFRRRIKLSLRHLRRKYVNVERFASENDEAGPPQISNPRPDDHPLSRFAAGLITPLRPWRTSNFSRSSRPLWCQATPSAARLRTPTTSSSRRARSSRRRSCSSLLRLDPTHSSGRFLPCCCAGLSIPPRNWPKFRRSSVHKCRRRLL